MKQRGTLFSYKILLDSFRDNGFQFQTFADFIKNPGGEISRSTA
jgi:hypothetical protein